MLQKQGVEISRATAPFTVMVPGKRGPARQNTTTNTNGAGGAGGRVGRTGGLTGQVGGPNAQDQERREDRNTPPPPVTRTFPAGSYIVRMDQPYSRIADSLLDYQYWSPNDPQRTPYDDTGWTFPELYNVQAVRVTDAKVLDARWRRSAGAVRRQRRGRQRDGGIGLRRQPQRRHRARHAALQVQGCVVRGGRGAVRRRRARSSAAARSSSRMFPRPTCRRPRPISACRSPRWPARRR